jgi:hypothetical protein
VLEGFHGPFETIRDTLRPPPGRVISAQRAQGFFLSSRVNDSFVAVNRVLRAGGQVFRLNEPVRIEGAEHAAGTFYIHNSPVAALLVDELSRDLGLTFHGSAAAPGHAAVALHPVRIALWDRRGGSMTSGWTRWILERFEFPFEVVNHTQIEEPDFRYKYDVLILPTGAVPERVVPAPKPAKEVVAKSAMPVPASGKTNAPEHETGASVPISKLASRVHEFIQNGGTALAIGTSTRLAMDFDLPVRSKLTRTNSEGKIVPLSTEQFYIPGSVLRARFNPEHPLAFGMDDEADVMFVKSPLFELAADAEQNGIAKVAWFDTANPLRSGWALGQEHLENGVSILDASIGSGRLVLFGPEILFRAQSHGAFKLLFNGILLHGAGAAGVPLQVSVEP